MRLFATTACAVALLCSGGATVMAQVPASLTPATDFGGSCAELAGTVDVLQAVAATNGDLARAMGAIPGETLDISQASGLVDFAESNFASRLQTTAAGLDVDCAAQFVKAIRSNTALVTAVAVDTAGMLTQTSTADPCAGAPLVTCVTDLLLRELEDLGMPSEDQALEILATQGDGIDDKMNLILNAQINSPANPALGSVVGCPADECTPPSPNSATTVYVGGRGLCSRSGPGTVKDQDNRTYWTNEHFLHLKSNVLVVCKSQAKTARSAVLNKYTDVSSGTYHAATNVNKGWGVGGGFPRRKGTAGCYFTDPTISQPGTYQAPTVDCRYTYGSS